MTRDDRFKRGTLSELVQRLRRMRWPEASPEARQRCWEMVSRQMEEGGPEPGAHAKKAEGLDSEAPELQERRLRRHEFAGAVRAAGENRHHGALGARVAVARQASRPLAFR
ncbi:MAG: hypothetical protein QOI91_133 [Solirubrobacteraceae bacterium]|jgi:hypothetical protein|nr:hypothetical protein [Solirubrobacteraceae bacterium]